MGKLVHTSLGSSYLISSGARASAGRAAVSFLLGTKSVVEECVIFFLCLSVSLSLSLSLPPFM